MFVCKNVLICGNVRALYFGRPFISCRLISKDCLVLKRVESEHDFWNPFDCNTTNEGFFYSFIYLFIYLFILFCLILDMNREVLIAPFQLFPRRRVSTVCVTDDLSEYETLPKFLTTKMFVVLNKAIFSLEKSLRPI